MGRKIRSRETDLRDFLFAIVLPTFAVLFGRSSLRFAVFVVVTVTVALLLVGLGTTGVTGFPLKGAEEDDDMFSKVRLRDLCTRNVNTATKQAIGDTKRQTINYPPTSLWYVR